MGLKEKEASVEVTGGERRGDMLEDNTISPVSEVSWWSGNGEGHYQSQMPQRNWSFIILKMHGLEISLCMVAGMHFWYLLEKQFLSFALPPSIHYICTEHCWLGLWPLGTQTKIWPSASLQLDGWDEPVNNQYGSGEVQTSVRPCERGEVSVEGFWSQPRRGELNGWEEIGS